MLNERPPEFAGDLSMLKEEGDQYRPLLNLFHKVYPDAKRTNVLSSKVKPAFLFECINNGRAFSQTLSKFLRANKDIVRDEECFK